MKYNMFYGRMPKKGLIMETSKDIQGMRKDVAQMKKEINEMVKMIPSILKANGIDMDIDIFGFDAPVGMVETIASGLRLMRMGDKLIEHWINTVEETNVIIRHTEKRIDDLEKMVYETEKNNKLRHEQIMERLAELQVDKQLPTVKQEYKKH
jgi:hypothetical protein